MIEKCSALAVMLVLIFTMIKQNRLVQVYVSCFAVYFFLGWVFAKHVGLWQLTFYSLSVVSLLTGVILSRLFISISENQNQPQRESIHIPSEGESFNPIVNFTLILLVVVSLVSYVVLVVMHGIPVLNISDRKDVSGFFTYLIGLIWILYPFMYVWLSKKKLLYFTALASIIMLTMGYRTPLVVTILMFVFLNVKYNRFYISKKTKAFGSIILLSIMTLYPLLRFQDDPEAIIKLLANLDMPPELFIFAPFILVFAEGSIVIKGINAILPDIGLQYGQFTLAGFSTILPGEQTHSRTLLSYWLGRTNWQESTTTSSILGQFYLEFGTYGAYILSFFVGVFITLGSHRFLTRNRPIESAPFLICFILLTISIHTGMLDPLVLYVLFIYITMIIIKKMGDVIFKK